MKSIIFILILAALLSSTIVRADKKISFSLEVLNTNSKIEILSTSLEFPSLTAEVKAFRGNTLKRTVYIKAVDQNDKTISSVEKFSLSKFNSTTDSFTLTLKSCKEKVFLLVYGLNIEKRKELSCPNNSLESSSVSSFDSLSSSQDSSLSTSSTLQNSSSSTDSPAEFSYNISFPKEIHSGENFSVRVHIQNPTAIFFEIDSWAYVYKSSKSYSGVREQNKKTINIPEFANITFDLPLSVDAVPGEYKLKFKLLLPNRKLPKELTEPITVLEFNQTFSKNNTYSKSFNETKQPSFSTSNFNSPNPDESDEYLSSSAKTKKLLPFFLILALAILLSLVVFKVL